MTHLTVAATRIIRPLRLRRPGRVCGLSARQRHYSASGCPMAEPGRQRVVAADIHLSSSIASVPTRISHNPLPGSWITSNTHPKIERVCFLWRSSPAVYPVYPVHPCSMCRASCEILRTPLGNRSHSPAATAAFVLNKSAPSIRMLAPTCRRKALITT